MPHYYNPSQMRTTPTGNHAQTHGSGLYSPYGKFGTPDMRASYSERLVTSNKNAAAARIQVAHMHPALRQSNGHLERTGSSTTTQNNNVMSEGGSVHREYGSHGSIDALGNDTEREDFIALLRDLGAHPSEDEGNANNSLTRDQALHDTSMSVGCAPSRLAELLKPNFSSSSSSSTSSKSHITTRGSGGPVSLTESSYSANYQQRSTVTEPSSPKPRSKFTKFLWDREKKESKNGGGGSNVVLKEHVKVKDKSKSVNVVLPTSLSTCASSVPPASFSNSSSSTAAAGGGIPNGSGGMGVAQRSSVDNSLFRKWRSSGGSQGNVSVSGTKTATVPANLDASPSALGEATMHQEPSSAAHVVLQDMDSESRLEEKTRKKAFGHHDWQSMTVNLGYAARLRRMLAQRRNTTTGASAASMVGQTGKNSLRSQRSVPESETPPLRVAEDPPEPTDHGDGKTNQLVLNCPYFRNELGGEPQWIVGGVTNPDKVGKNSNMVKLHSEVNGIAPSELYRRPANTYGVTVLESRAGNTHWRTGLCPYQKQRNMIEGNDQGAYYYHTYFYGQEHQNWFGMDDNLGPLAISIKREKVEEDSNQSQFRLIIRTSELLTMRGTIMEDAIPTLKAPGSKGLHTRDVLDFMAPEIQLSCLRLAISGVSTEDQLLKLDQQGLSSQYKVGVLYCKAHQATEEEMYNNEDAGPAFLEFLDLIGQRVRLKSFDKYKAGLDNKMDSTGLFSVYAQYQNCEVMFHVSTMLPFTPNNRQQLLRKRHIGNDIVTIVFQEPGALPFTPRNIRSQFQHVFIVVRAHNPCTEHVQYSVAISRSKEVPTFGPALPDPAVFSKNSAFVEFLLAKAINAEHAAHRSAKFATMATRTRQEYLKDLAANYVTAMTLDTGSKFPSMLTFTSRKKERLRAKFKADRNLRGAVCWLVQVEDSSNSGIPAFLGVAAETLILVEETTKTPIFAITCKTVLGWATTTTSLRVYYHQGESICLHCRDTEADEIPEICDRLRMVTSGTDIKEMTLNRNALGQLGFHVQPDGLVTEVQPHGPAWVAGLRQGARLVEICKMPVANLSHEQMVDLLKTSLVVSVTLIPPLPDGTPRKGCNVEHCPYLSSSLEGDYENLQKSSQCESLRSMPGSAEPHSGFVLGRNERSLSPPRSSGSSGYGTGSSSRSYGHPEHQPIVVPKDTGTLTSTSSGHSSDDPWYDPLPDSDVKSVSDSPPPPLPNRATPNQRKSQNTASRLRTGYSCELFTGNEPKLSLPDAESHVSAQSSSKASANQRDDVVGGSLDSSNRLKTSRSHDQIFKPHNGNYMTPPPPKPRYNTTHVHPHASENKDRSMRDRKEGSPGPVPAPQEPGGCGKLREKHYMTPRPLQPPDYQAAVHGRLLALKNSSPNQSAPIHHSSFQTHSASSSPLSDRLMGARSEEELSAGSVSPVMRRRCKAQGRLTPSSGSSRNQSPRTTTEARLRNNSSGRNSQRSSAHLPSSNLQEELMRLINPDEAEDGQPSEELRSQRGDHEEETAETLIFTHARPVTVISNASPSPALPDPFRDDVAQLRSQPSPAPVPVPLLFPDADQLEWSTLVEAAARAIQGAALSLRSEPANGRERDHEADQALATWIQDMAENLRMDPNRGQGQVPGMVASSGFDERMRSLQSHVGSLETRLRSEEGRREVLEEEVRRLRDDNRRLQGESQAASEQLKRFTDWFFQTIERQ